MTRCPLCGAEFHGEKCPVCGWVKTSEETWKCPVCGVDVDKDTKVCPVCGHEKK